MRVYIYREIADIRRKTGGGYATWICFQSRTCYVAHENRMFPILIRSEKGKLLPAYIRPSALVLLHEVNLLKETLT
jgi:hypothetical protein